MFDWFSLYLEYRWTSRRLNLGIIVINKNYTRRFILYYNLQWCVWHNVLGRVQSTCQSVTTETDFFCSDESKSRPPAPPPPQPPITSSSSSDGTRNYRHHHHGYDTQQHWFSTFFFFMYIFIMSTIIIFLVWFFFKDISFHVEIHCVAIFLRDIYNRHRICSENNVQYYVRYTPIGKILNYCIRVKRIT